VSSDTDLKIILPEIINSHERVYFPIYGLPSGTKGLCI